MEQAGEVRDQDRNPSPREVFHDALPDRSCYGQLPPPFRFHYFTAIGLLAVESGILVFLLYLTWNLIFGAGQYEPVPCICTILGPCKFYDVLEQVVSVLLVFIHLMLTVDLAQGVGLLFQQTLQIRTGILENWLQNRRLYLGFVTLILLTVYVSGAAEENVDSVLTSICVILYMISSLLVVRNFMLQSQINEEEEEAFHQAVTDMMEEDAALLIMNQAAAMEMMNQAAAMEMMNQAADGNMVNQAADGNMVNQAADGYMVNQAADGNLVNQAAADEILNQVQAADDENMNQVQASILELMNRSAVLETLNQAADNELMNQAAALERTDQGADDPMMNLAAAFGMMNQAAAFGLLNQAADGNMMN